MSAVQSSSAIAFEGVTPVLRVADAIASRDYYVKVLGFSVDFEYPSFVAVSRGRAHLFLSEGDQGQAGSWVWIGVSDAKELLSEYVASGAKIRHEPTNYPWALELQVEDLDGNILRMGSEALEGEPVGEWLDMYGTLWKFENSRWTRKQ